MGATLRVDPAQLRHAAKAQADVATAVSGLDAGQAVSAAGGRMSGLLSETACQFAATVFEAAAGTVHDELTAHSTNLSAAADRYQQADEKYARRLRAFGR
jgi:hypothetical protein